MKQDKIISLGMVMILITGSIFVPLSVNLEASAGTEEEQEVSENLRTNLYYS
jgi:hypothetical protein